MSLHLSVPIDVDLQVFGLWAKKDGLINAAVAIRDVKYCLGHNQWVRSQDVHCVVELSQDILPELSSINKVIFKYVPDLHNRPKANQFDWLKWANIPKLVETYLQPSRFFFMFSQYRYPTRLTYWA